MKQLNIQNPGKSEGGDGESDSDEDDKNDRVPQNPFDINLCKSLYFDDGVRSIDFVLIYQRDECVETETERQSKRDIFLRNLESEGLELELIIKDSINCVKLHAPLEILRRYCEILKLRMPMKQVPGMLILQKANESVFNTVCDFGKKVAEKFVFGDKYFSMKKNHQFTAIYSRHKEYLFNIKESSFFSSTVRSRIVQFILERKRFSLDEDEEHAFGIDRLIAAEVYIGAFPLHDGDIHAPGSTRATLYKEWASVKNWYRYQPLDYIKEYFGVKIGLYFAWLGFYTNMLLLASLVGVSCFIYAWLTIDTNKPSLDVCETGKNITMCPLCDHWCDYWNLSETCLSGKIKYLFDNPTTVFFAVFMSFWTTLFLAMWKRYSAEITHRWDLTGFDAHDEHPRPEYLARLSKIEKRQRNIITNQIEPKVSFWRMKLPATIFSFSVIMLLILLAIVVVLGVVLYRISVLASLAAYGQDVTTSQALLFTTATAATINLCLIVLFNWLYTYLAEYLTEFELLRTQTEFDDSLTLKIYLLQFVNYYASIFYIAFFKGKFVGYPGNYQRLLNFRQEECDFGGCMMDLSIQLAIIMIGKQAFSSVIEILTPCVERWYLSYSIRGSDTSGGFQERWVRDLKLIPWGSRSMFNEYLEMVLQYGFVTIFVAAFPIAPLFALINNIFEIRLDAKKLLKHHRRPVDQRVRDIGVWYRILDGISKLSVITNGFIIAFTSDFIPQLVYRLKSSPNGTLDGYLEDRLAYFNTSDFDQGSTPHRDNMSVPLCRYLDYRQPPWVESQKYERTEMFWYVLAARLAFVLIFENFLVLVMIIVSWAISDKPANFRDQIRREAYITNEIIIKHEAMRTVGLRRTMSMREPREIPVRNLINPVILSSEFVPVHKPVGDFSTIADESALSDVIIVSADKDDRV